jgi:hypothetical protein
VQSQCLALYDDLVAQLDQREVWMRTKLDRFYDDFSWNKFPNCDEISRNYWTKMARNILADIPDESALDEFMRCTRVNDYITNYVNNDYDDPVRFNICKALKREAVMVRKKLRNYN